MDGRQGERGPSSYDVRSACLDVGADHDVRIDFELVPSSAPKLGQLYIRAEAHPVGDAVPMNPPVWRGVYFPSNGVSTITGALYGLVMGLDADLTRREERAASLRQADMFDALPQG